ncbi:MAG TPA: putative sulfate exporter family transporter [Azospirillaceae bacterium]|nr:putative sulfate exporter family transporter [Azospirillaceae bacterium]
MSADNAAEMSSGMVARLSAQAAAAWRGLLVCTLIAAAAAFVSGHYGGPVVLYALLMGLACTFLRDDVRLKPGLDMASRFVLRLGVALLGARVAAGQVAELGAGTLVVVVCAMAFTFLVSVPLARLLGFGRDFALLAATATAVCGVSAALTAASILPKRPGSERDTAFVALGVTLLSTVAMIAYPLLTAGIFEEFATRGVFLGATIHDVAQVVGAGDLLRQAAEDAAVGEGALAAAVLTKLARVALLVPVSICLAVYAASAMGAQGGLWRKVRRALTLPWFLIVFVVLAFLNGSHLLPAGTGDALSPASRACLVVAITAIGIKTGVRQMVDMGWRATLLLVGLTLAIALATGAGLIVRG